MPRFADLAPDQKAVLQLLLKQGKSYDDIAGLLRLDRSSVRERALDALDALGAEAPGADALAPERQDELADHLLLQQSEAERSATQAFLAGSAPARSWAQVVSEELQPIAGAGLPAIPAAADDADPDDDAGAPLAGPPADDTHRPGSSRLGGILVLVAVGAVLVLGLVLLLRKDNGGSTSTPSASVSTDAGVVAAGCSSGTTGIPAQQQVNLKPPAGTNPKALGFAIIQQGGMQLVVQGLSRSTLYKVWLWNSPSDAVPLGFATYDTKTKRVVGAVQTLPAGTAGCSNLVITRERTKSSATPGPVVQSGALKKS